MFLHSNVDFYFKFEHLKCKLFFDSPIQQLQKSNTNVSFLFISMVELDHQSLVTKTLVNKMGLNT